MRSGNGRASSRPAAIAAAAASSVGVRPNRSDSAPQNAEPIANEPSAASVCSAVARARTQGGTLVWVAVL
jgi:hypothetical protein